jgi:hypothetical protein
LTLLAEVAQQGDKCCIAGVSLGDTLSLAPNQSREIQGYVFTLQVQGNSFRVNAVPRKEKETGYYSFFVTEDHIVRYGGGRPVFLNDLSSPEEKAKPLRAQ